MCGDEGPLRGGRLGRIGLLQEMSSSPRQTAPWFADDVDGNREAVDCNHDAEFEGGGNGVLDVSDGYRDWNIKYKSHIFQQTQGIK